MKTITVLIVFVLLGGFFIISNNNLHLGNSGEFNSFMSQYYGWFVKLIGNVKDVTGYVINVDWMPSSKESKDI